MGGGTAWLFACVAATGVASVIAVACTGDNPITGQTDPDASTNTSSSGGSSGTSSSGGSSGTIADGGVDAFTPAACTADTVRCQGAQVEKCNAEGTGYVVQKLCDTAELCKADNGGSCDSPACAANATRCTGADFERCNSGRTGWTKERTCGSAVLCRADGTGDGGAGCTAPQCATGERHCDLTCLTIANHTTNDCIMKCKSDRTGYENESDCGNAMAGDRCDEPTAGNPSCN